MKLLDGIEAIIFDFDFLYDNKDFNKELLKKLLFDYIKVKKSEKLREEFGEQIFDSEKEAKSAYFEKFSQKLNCSLNEAENWYYKKYMESVLKILSSKYAVRKNLNYVYSILKHKKIKIVVLGELPIVKEEMETLCVYEKFADEIYSLQKLGGFNYSTAILEKISKQIEVSEEKILYLDGKNGISWDDFSKEIGA